MTLIPGKNDSDSTRMVISAQRAQIDRIDDASIFTFAARAEPGARLRALWKLSQQVDCAALNQVCGPNANCVNVVPAPFKGEPDLGPTGARDLGVAEEDMAATT